MKTDQVAEDNLEIVLDWIDAMRVGDPDRFADRLALDVVWWDVSGQPACRGRAEVLEWLRAGVAAPARTLGTGTGADRHERARRALRSRPGVP